MIFSFVRQSEKIGCFTRKYDENAFFFTRKGGKECSLPDHVIPFMAFNCLATSVNKCQLRLFFFCLVLKRLPIYDNAFYSLYMLYVHVVTSATHKLVNQYQLQLQYQGKKSFFFFTRTRTFDEWKRNLTSNPKDAKYEVLFQKRILPTYIQLLHSSSFLEKTKKKIRFNS